MSFMHYQFVWWIFIGAVLFLLALTMGFDFGVAALMPFSGKNNLQRRTIINSIGSTWAGNQIWLVMGGGTIYAVWPQIYATTFSGFYGAMILFLWALFARPIVIEWRAKLVDHKWISVMDWLLALCSGFAAVAIGLLIGNLFVGVPFHYLPDMRSIYTGNMWLLFNPFSILVGLVSLFMMLMHGAAYMRMTTDLSIAHRCNKVVRWFAVLFILGFAGAGLWLAFGIKGYHLVKAAGIQNMRFNVVELKTGAWLANYHHFKWFIMMPILGFVGAIWAFIFSGSKRYYQSFIGSSVATLGAVLTFGGSLYPFLLPSSTHLANSLTVWNATSSPMSLHVMFVAAVIMLPIILLYTLFIYYKMSRRVTMAEIEQNSKTLY